MKFNLNGINISEYLSADAKFSSSEVDDSSCSYVDLDGVTHNAKLCDKLTITLHTTGLLAPIADAIWASLHTQTLPVVFDVLGYNASITCTCRERSREFISTDYASSMSVISFTLEEV
jgi:hypothetical protein